MRLTLAMVALAGFTLAQEKAAQEKGGPQPKVVQRLVEVKNADTAHVAHLVEFPGLMVKFDDSMHVITLYGVEKAVNEVEAMIHKLDVAPVQTDITVYIVAGTPQAGDDLPADLASTAKQLHSILPYKSYHLLDSFVVRNREGRRNDVSGMLPGSTNAFERYTFGFVKSSLMRGTPRVLVLDNVVFNLQYPIKTKEVTTPAAYRQIDIRSDVSLAEGQKVVVGRSNMNGADETLILVMTAKVVE